MKVLLLLLLLLSAVPFAINAYAHGGHGTDRAPEIDFENRNVTIIGTMSPSDMTIGDFSNAFLKLELVEVFEIISDKKLEDHTCTKESNTYICKYDVTIPQTTFAVEMLKGDKLLKRGMFYADNGTLTINIRPDDSCDISEPDPWRCTKLYGTEHPLIKGALYSFGENNPVIEGAIFTNGGLYQINVEVLGTESPRSNLAIPLEFDISIAIAQEQTFYITVPDGLVM